MTALLSRPLPILLTGLLLGCATADGPLPAPSEAETAAFVTLLGNDTLAVEQFTYRPDGLDATVLLRTPRTSVTHYTIETGQDGGMTRFEAVERAPGAADDAPPLSRTVGVVENDSLTWTVDYDGETETRRYAVEAGLLPFIDMVHWPYELALRRAAEADADSLTQPLLAGRSAMPFVIRRVGPEAMTITHPFRGTMEVEVDEAGRLVMLDAGATTRKLVVTRVPVVDVDGLSERFATLDMEGQNFGPLSSRGETQAEIDGALLSVDYGVPMKRGRVIFGELVPYGERWRTGANRATHFTTDRTIRLRDLVVPAGTYTLYTIPESGGGTLIVNRQTGQGGTSYDASQDLGRVALDVAGLDETVEAFTIAIDDTPGGGLLRLQWDQTEYTAPFTVE